MYMPQLVYFHKYKYTPSLTFLQFFADTYFDSLIIFALFFYSLFLQELFI